MIDTEYFSLKKIVPTGNLKGIDVKKIKNADKITSLFTTGQVAGKAVGDQGTAPRRADLPPAGAPKTANLAQARPPPERQKPPIIGRFEAPDPRTIVVRGI